MKRGGPSERTYAIGVLLGALEVTTSEAAALARFGPIASRVPAGTRAARLEHHGVVEVEVTTGLVRSHRGKSVRVVEVQVPGEDTPRWISTRRFEGTATDDVAEVIER